RRNRNVVKGYGSSGEGWRAPLPSRRTPRAEDRSETRAATWKKADASRADVLALPGRCGPSAPRLLPLAPSEHCPNSPVDGDVGVRRLLAGARTGQGRRLLPSTTIITSGRRSWPRRSTS